GTVLAIACTYLVLDARKAREWNRLRPTALLALGVGVLCWLPPAIEGIAHSGGNIRALWKYWSAHHAVITGPAAGARMVGARLALPARWFSGHEQALPFTGGIVPTWHAPFALAFLAGALVVAMRTSDRQSARLCVLALGLVAAAWISASRIIDTPFGYLV